MAEETPQQFVIPILASYILRLILHFCYNMESKVSPDEKSEDQVIIVYRLGTINV